jgi:hypothetical protein
MNNLLDFQIKKALRGVKVEVTHRGNMRRKYRIAGLTSQETRELTYGKKKSMFLHELLHLHFPSLDHLFREKIS